MKTSEYLDLLSKWFVTRTDVFGMGYPDPKNPLKYRYTCVKEPLTSELLIKHAKGDIAIGVYNMSDAGYVSWFCADMDAPKDAEGNIIANPFEVALQDAIRQRNLFENAGLFTYLERSRSGGGAHVWGFLSEPMPAEVVRRALRPLALTDSAFDQLYPMQEGVTEKKPYGNLIHLPFQGEAIKRNCSVFIRDDGSPLKPSEALHMFEANQATVLERLAEKAPKQRVPKLVKGKQKTEISTVGPAEGSWGPALTGALKVLSPYGCTFFRHCFEKRKGLNENIWYAGLQIAAHFEEGRGLAHCLSLGDPRYDEGTVDAKYDQAVANPKVGCKWIHETYPQLACKRCPNIPAPQHIGKRTILELVGGVRNEMNRIGSFDKDLEKVKARQKGEQLTGYQWGIKGLDNYSRMRNSEYIVIGAPPSIGKTHFMVHSMLRAARPIPKVREALYVFVFSAETGQESLRTRVLANMAEVDSRKLTGESEDALTSVEWARIEKAADILAELPIFMDFTALTADDVLLQIESVLLRERIPLDTPYVVYFDYLQYGAKRPGDDSDFDRLSRLSTEFKGIAKILNRPIVVFSQLTRDSEGVEMPTINMFKGTGRIETDMDLGIIFTGERVEGSHAPRAMNIVKQREGLANVRLDFTLQQTYGGWEFYGQGQYPADTDGPPLFHAMTAFAE